MTDIANTPFPVAEFTPPTAGETREREVIAAHVRTPSQMKREASTPEDREQKFLSSLTPEQQERMPRLQARAKRLADAGDIEGATRIKRMFDSPYTKTAERPDGTEWDYTSVTQWTIEDATAQITEPLANGKPAPLAEQVRRFWDCSERKHNKDGEPVGPPKLTDNNVEVWLRSREWFTNLTFSRYNGGRLAWRNEGMRITLPEWRKGSTAEQPDATLEGNAALLNRFVTDADIMRITADLRRAFGVDVSQWNENKTEAFLLQLVSGDTVDPLLEYIKGLEWDGVTRIPTMISNLDHTDYTRAWSEMLVYSLIHRLLNPGAKVDLVFTLQGGQGLWKTAFFKGITVGILPTPTFAMLPTESKDELMKTQGGAVVLLDEIDELIENAKGGRGSHAGQLKSFISSETDTYRAPYARTEREHPRVYTIGATTNRTDFISDLDGHRRWAVLSITEPIPEELRPNGDRSYWDALLAEAYHRYTVEGYRGPSYDEFLRLSEPSRLSHLDDPVYDSLLDWLELPAADRVMDTTVTTPRMGNTDDNSMYTKKTAVNIDCLDIRLIRDAIPDLERRKISGSFKQQVTGAMNRMPGFARVELEKNDKGEYKKKRRTVNGTNKPIHIAWDMLATVQAYDASNIPVGEPVDILASDVPDISAYPKPMSGYSTRVDAYDRLVADRPINAGDWPTGFLPAGAAYARVDFPYDVPLTSVSTNQTLN